MQYKPFNRFNFIIKNWMQNLMFKFNFASSIIPASESASKIVELAIMYDDKNPHAPKILTD